MHAFLELEQAVRWYRGMSDKQICACNKMLYALRDDIEQESTYRVNDCLLRLGLQPLPNARQIKVILDISQGNDLAFLWFLWEAHYMKTKSCVDSRVSYSINEQLILSAIAHLDTASTMRALDAILPAPELSTKYQAREQARLAKLAKRRQQQAKRAQARIGVETHKLPYLQRQRRPKIYRPMSSVATPRDRVVSFPQYDSYKDPMYRIPNECSRWFASYEFSPVKREVKHCLSQALAQLFAGSRTDTAKSLCQLHRQAEHATERKQQELTVETLRRCMQLLDVQGMQQKRRTKRILAQLEHEVFHAAEQLRQHRYRQLTQVVQLNSESGCQLCVQLLSSPSPSPSPLQADKDFRLLLAQEQDWPNHPLPDVDELNVPVLVWGQQTQLKTINLGREARKLATGHAARRAQYKRKSCTPQCQLQGRIQVLDEQGALKHTVWPFELSACPTENCSSERSEDKYCSKRSYPHGRLDWNYFKVFKPPAQSEGDQLPQDARSLIRNYCIEALRLTIKAESENEEKRKNQLPFVRSGLALEAAGKCAVDMFQLANREQLAKLVVEDSDEVIESVTSIDPENKQQLIEVTKSGIDKLRENPRYVLATLPNAHMLPVLLDWVALRYGKTYSYRQMNELAKTSRNIYEHLAKNANNRSIGFPAIPKHLLSNNLSMCHSEQIRRRYHRRLNKIGLAESRLVWLALRGYSHLSGMQGSTFFAYLPGKEQDFMRHNLWQSSDYRPVHSFRQLLKQGLQP